MASLQGLTRRLKDTARFVTPMDRAGDVLRQMATLPFGDIGTIAGADPVLVLAPHPDDESLGCGGFIAQACAAGIEVHVAILTDGSASHPGSRAYPPSRLVPLRAVEAEAAVQVLGVPADRLHFLNHRDGGAPLAGAALTCAASSLAALARTRAIGTVLATWQHDPHCDHLSAHRIAVLAAAAAPFRLLSYPVWGWTLPATRWLPRQAIAGWRLDITAELATKRRAIDCHRSQMTGLITDDAAGFVLPQALLDACSRPFEVFLQAPARR